MTSVTSRPPGRDSSSSSGRSAPGAAAPTPLAAEHRPSGAGIRWEARWIVPATVVGTVATSGPPQARVDFYDVETLRVDRALKLRGGTRLELKEQVDAPRSFEYDGIVGIAERWRKQPVAATTDEPRFRWIRVPKKIWRRPGFEIVRIDVEKGWWSIAIDVDRMDLATASRELAGWRPLLRTEHATTYCQWLIRQLEAGRTSFRPGPWPEAEHRIVPRTPIPPAGRRAS